MGLRAVVYYLTTTFSAVILGIILVLTIRPGEKGNADINKTGKTVQQEPLDALFDLIRYYLIRSTIKPPKWLCAQRRLRSACASVQSDQSSTLRCALIGKLRTQCFFMLTTKTLIRLGECPGWSVSSLCSHVILLVLSCAGKGRVAT